MNQQPTMLQQLQQLQEQDTANQPAPKNPPRGTGDVRFDRSVISPGLAAKDRPAQSASPAGRGRRTKKNKRKTFRRKSMRRK